MRHPEVHRPTRPGKDRVSSSVPCIADCRHRPDGEGLAGPDRVGDAGRTTDVCLILVTLPAPTRPDVRRRTGCCAPQDTATRERKSLNGLWRFRLDPAGEGRAAAVVRRRRCRTRRAMAVPASYNDISADAARPRPRRRGLVPDRRAGAARLGRPAGRPALRVGHPPRHRLGQRRGGGLATRAATRRSRPTSPSRSAPGEPSPDHRAWSTTR